MSWTRQPWYKQADYAVNLPYWAIHGVALQTFRNLTTYRDTNLSGIIDPTGVSEWKTESNINIAKRRINAELEIIRRSRMNAV